MPKFCNRNVFLIFILYYPLATWISIYKGLNAKLVIHNSSLPSPGAEIHNKLTIDYTLEEVL
jgi:hypothetical protein